MVVRLKRRVAMFTLVMLAFAQASVTLSGCAMDRGTMSTAMAADNDESRADCEMPITKTSPQKANLCALHCTWDLQAASGAVAVDRSPADWHIAAVALPRSAPARRPGLHAPPSIPPPHRILLPSFLTCAPRSTARAVR